MHFHDFSICLWSLHMGEIFIKNRNFHGILTFSSTAVQMISFKKDIFDKNCSQSVEVLSLKKNVEDHEKLNFQFIIFEI